MVDRNLEQIQFEQLQKQSWQKKRQLRNNRNDMRLTTLRMVALEKSQLVINTKMLE